MSMPEQDSISRLSADFAADPKWHDEDTDREYLSHMDEFEREGTYKNLVDAAIIQRIKARIAMNRARQLLQQYDSETGTSYRDILAARLAKFREYEHVPFPAQEKTAAIEGLPDRSDYGDLSSLGADGLATLVRQRHDAERARTHEDMRIGGPGGLHSWAVPKFMPEKPGDKRLAIEQPIHQWSYKDFQGRLNHGYGKGNVTKMEESPVVILKNTGNHIMFTRGDSKDAPVYQLIRTKDRDWLLFIKAKDQPVQVRKYPKEHFKQAPIDQLPELIANGASISRKIDGAGMLAYLGKHGVEAYGIRANAQGDKPEYTDIIGNLRSIQVPKDLQGTLLRGEVFGMRGNKSIPANELSGILNSTIRNAAYKKQGNGIRLLIAGLAVHDNGKDDYDQEKVNSIISRLGTDAIVPMRRYSGKDALAALVAMKRGQDKLTHEGFVVHVPGKRPLKAKFKEDADVVVRNVFKADTDADNRAGGFEYSLPGSDKVIGRVGTGFDYVTLRDMLTNPNNYIGRTARIQSQEQYPSGAYRAPSFIAMKED